METETAVVLLVLLVAGGTAYYLYTKNQGAKKKATPNLSTAQKVEAVGGKLLAVAPPVIAGRWISGEVVKGAELGRKGLTAGTSAIGRYVTTPIGSGVSSVVRGIGSIF